MTLIRDPLSLEAALDRIARRLPGGWTAMAAICDRAVSTVRGWATPGADDCIPMRCARALDLAWHRAGGLGWPLLEVYERGIDRDRRQLAAASVQLIELATRSLHEGAQASAAQFACILPDASIALKRTAIRETEEKIVADLNTLAGLRDSAGLSPAGVRVGREC